MPDPLESSQPGNGYTVVESGLVNMRKLFDRMPFSLLVVLCLTLGLAPFSPEPHVWEKLGMLASGELVKGIDIFDLALHGAPWLLLIGKVSVMSKSRSGD
jgi:hypothetical protein